MQRQGNFITGFWPKDVQADLAGSVDVMPFPAYEGGYDGVPVLGGGDLAATFNGDDPDVQEVMEFITSDQFGHEWAAAGGWLSPHKTFDALDLCRRHDAGRCRGRGRRGRVPVRRL